MLDILQASLLIQDLEFFPLLVSSGVQFANLRSLLRKLHWSLELHLSDYEFAVAQLTNFAFEFHAVCVDACSRKHSLFVETVLAITDATELTKMHLRVLFEDVVIATLARTELCFLSIRGWEEEDWIFVACCELVLTDSHLALWPCKPLEILVYPRKLFVQFKLILEVLKECISIRHGIDSWQCALLTSIYTQRRCPIARAWSSHPSWHAHTIGSFWNHGTFRKFVVDREMSG